jgi:hypothetical protein
VSHSNSATPPDSSLVQPCKGIDIYVDRQGRAVVSFPGSDSLNLIRPMSKTPPDLSSGSGNLWLHAWDASISEGESGNGRWNLAGPEYVSSPCRGTTIAITSVRER